MPVTRGPTTRRRALPYKVGKSVFQQAVRVNGSVISQPAMIRGGEEVSGTQVTVSEGHPFNSRRKGDRGDIGGDFFTQRKYIASQEKPVAIDRVMEYPNGNADLVKYLGPAYPIFPGAVQFPPSMSSPKELLDQMGATAVARCKPTNSIADLSTFLGELYKDRLPDLIGSTFWKDRTATSRKAGNEYLNLEFGWKPLVNDVYKFVEAVGHADAALEQYYRDAGRLVRRRYEFPKQSAREEHTLYEQERPWTPTSSTLMYEHPNAFGRLVRVREKTQRLWFSGAFTYTLPLGMTSRSRMNDHALKANKIFGLTLTPEVLWNLAPWSWAVDWFSNTGDVISNISDSIADGLVMQYGYVMEHTIVSDTYTLSPSPLYGGAAIAPLKLVTETKIRQAANPFGFGVSWNGLSPRQLAIAAALGLSRR